MRPILCLALFLSLIPSLAAAPAWAQAANPIAPERHVIVASGSAQADVPPDQVRISAGVVSTGQSAADALAANSRAMTAVFAALKAKGIADSAIHTSGFSLQPQYNAVTNLQPERRITSYNVSNQIQVMLDDPAKAGTILDALVQAGANQSAGISYSLRDSKPLMTQLRAAAVADARARAETFAKAAGVTLGPAIMVQEGASFAGPVGSNLVTVTGTLDRAAPPPPVSAGTQTLTSNVTVTFAIP
jgi:uncharacterized protein YggE